MENSFQLSNCRIVTENEIIDGTLTVSNGIITDISKNSCESGMNLNGAYVFPGFVDIHSHGGGDFWFFENPKAAAQWHLERGTTSMLCSMWRNAGTYSYEKAVTNVYEAMKTQKNIKGIHMEGPYVDPDLGSEGGTPYPINVEEYTNIIEKAHGTIKTWTFDPTQDGAVEFAKYTYSNKIKLGVCYSKSSPELLENFLEYGLSIGSHILCATGAPTPKFVGTKEPGSDVFVLTRDEMTAEIIADSYGAHTRPYFLKLIYKCKGADKIALISDYCPGGETLDSDVNIINGELYGSRLSMSVAIKNMRKHTSASIIDLAKMSSTTPSKAIGIYNNVGSIEVGKIADLVILNDDLDVLNVISQGAII